MAQIAAPSTLVVVFETIDVCARFFPLPPDRRLIFTYGEQVPDEAAGLSYWTSGEHAARLLCAGLAPALSAPPQDWMSTIDPAYLGRAVSTVRLDELPADRDQLFVKPAGFKVPRLGAGIWNPSRFAARARELGVPEQAMVQYTPSVLDLDHEHRFVVVDGQVVTGSPYLIAGASYHPAMASPRFTEAQAYATRTAAALAAVSPPAFTLDVGWDRGSNRWAVVEANAMWSSGMYGCDPAAFIEAVEVANRTGHGRWAWRPDPYLRQRAERAPRVRAVPAEQATGWMAVPLP